MGGAAGREAAAAMAMAGRTCRRLLLLFGCWSLVAGQVTQREVPENDPVDLSCDAYLAQQGNPRIEWKFEKGETVTLLYRDSQFTEPYKGCVQFTPSSIHFSSVTRKDTGKYICEVLGESGQLSRSEVNLVVQVAPSKPVASVPASVTIGNKAELTCKESDGSPPPTFLWYRNNIQMPVNPNTSEAFKNSSYELNPKTGQLTFDPVTGFDTGDYYCEAQNNVGTPQKSDTYHLEASNNISYEDMKALVASGGARIFDVRSPEEVANGHIANSINIPVTEIEEALKMDPETFKMKYAVDKPQVDEKNFIFLCKAGRRSAFAVEIAKTLGYTNSEPVKKWELWSSGWRSYPRPDPPAPSGAAKRAVLV
ncbi:junctional adhesion molecule A-like isoform X1 [Alligator mississippiensis]|uniref:junctional adhesion molecule A-like isoform X1 n=1 Tax=Alligator mississippiensis TaxID=8496 RepID=UPI002877B81F|nr:junctional adhesion molecule A-like isoform X1 [Alligator mississippiensis]